ncbi:hypothetical protein [Streptomyces sp. NPDC093094]|uniref:hypothetical protein n=1 Tax=Streptomyces sp. NPDC093094 TaxID=3366026 RepID=UPI0038283794
MRAGRSVRVRCAPVLLLCGVLLTGCQGFPGSGGARASAPSPRPAGYGAEFLAVGECSSFGTTHFTEVSCAGERAAARVVARHGGRAGGGPPCPGTTDFVLHISPRGYACMRGLQPPHPGDPGAGGGPRTVVGDCVYSSGGGQVRETRCDGKGGRAPEFEVTAAVRRRADCPASTALYVQLGGGDPVGCARPV